MKTVRAENFPPLLFFRRLSGLFDLKKNDYCLGCLKRTLR
jgi:hypothetical protein